MDANKKVKSTNEAMPQAMPDFESLSDLVEWAETHDMAEVLDALPEVACEIDIQRRTLLVEVDLDLMQKLAATAKARHVPVETLVRSWLQEKVAQAA